MPRPDLQIGDRVREAERLVNHVFTEKSPNFKQAASYQGTRRSGVVVGFTEQPIRGGRSALYVQVQWDHLKSPSLHARFRLERVGSESGAS